MRAVALMSLWKVKNALRTLFTDPRKLVPALLFLVLMAFPLTMTILSRGMSNSYLKQAAFSRRYTSRYGGSRTTSGASVRTAYDASRFNPAKADIDPNTFSAAITLTLILIGIAIINTGLGDRLLALGPSDVDYLFPAPISRRVVLAYRIPGLTVGSVGIALYLLFMISMFTQVLEPNFPNSGTTISPWWVNPAALFLSGGVYLNIAMYLSVQFSERSSFKKGLWVFASVLGIAFGYVAYVGGVESAVEFLQMPVLRSVFIPSALASDTVVAAYSQQPAGAPLLWLLFGYLGTLALLLSSDSNWYEQSIASTDKWTALRQAAKGGWSGVMAAKASSYRYRGSKPYTIRPFGSRAIALFWAHLCAAAKKPIPNFIVPLMAGLVVGGGGAVAIRSIVNNLGGPMRHGSTPIVGAESFGYTLVGVMVFYLWQGFMTTSRTASESSIRRRELVAPLPISGWQSVAADMGVPVCAILVCFVSAAITYIALGGPNPILLGFGFGISMPLRLATRIVLQHIVVIAYPDLADKMQRLISMLIGSIVGIPFLLLEVVVCLPGVFLHSIWAALIPLTLIQFPLGALFLFLAGKASERAIATGEPVRLIGLVRT